MARLLSDYPPSMFVRGSRCRKLTRANHPQEAVMRFPVRPGPRHRPEFALMRFSNLARGWGGSVGLDRLRGGGHAFPLGGGSDRDPTRHYSCFDGLSSPQFPAEGHLARSATRLRWSGRRGRTGFRAVTRAGWPFSLHQAGDVCRPAYTKIGPFPFPSPGATSPSRPYG
jgi:hypothetical protein